MRTEDKFPGKKELLGIRNPFLKGCIDTLQEKKGCCSFDHLSEIVIHGAVSAVF